MDALQQSEQKRHELAKKYASVHGPEREAVIVAAESYVASPDGVRLRQLIGTVQALHRSMGIRPVRVGEGMPK